MPAFAEQSDLAGAIGIYGIRSNTLYYLENVGIQFLSLRQLVCRVSSSRRSLHESPALCGGFDAATMDLAVSENA
jgi:hypothetical protein